MYIAPHGDPLATFIMYVPPLALGTGWAMVVFYACNIHVGHIIQYRSLMDIQDTHLIRSFKVYQVICFGNFESHTFLFVRWRTMAMMLAMFNSTCPLRKVHFPRFCQNIGVMSNDSTVGWRELDVFQMLITMPLATADASTYVYFRIV